MRQKDKSRVTERLLTYSAGRMESTFTDVGHTSKRRYEGEYQKLNFELGKIKMAHRYSEDVEQETAYPSAVLWFSLGLESFGNY